MEYVSKQEFEALEKRVAKLEGSGPQKKNMPKSTSTKEFLLGLNKKLKTDIERVICLIYFIEELKGDAKDGISSNELKKVFKEAREKVPKNISDVLIQCSKKGWISMLGKEGRKNKWTLTNTGIKYVEDLCKNENDK